MHDGILNKVSAECVAVKSSVQLNCSTNRFVGACLLKIIVSVISHRIRTNIYMGRCLEETNRLYVCDRRFHLSEDQCCGLLGLATVSSGS